MSAGIRPLTRTIVLGVVGLLLTIMGFGFASIPTVGAGVLILIAILTDGLRFLLIEGRKPMDSLVRVARPNPGSAGEKISVHLIPRVALTTRSIDSTGLEEWVPDELSSAVDVLPRGMRPQGAVLAYELVPPRRGQWTLGPASLTRFSALGLWWARVVDATTSQVTAWPRIVEIRSLVVAEDREGTVGRLGYVQPHQDNTTVRAYSPGDDLRRVHWRSSARRGELMTRAEEPTEADRAWVGVMVSQNSPFALRELAISLAGSWVVDMDRAGFDVDLACGSQMVRSDLGELLTLLAIVSDEEVAGPITKNPIEGVSLLIMATDGQDMTIVSPPQGRSRRNGGALAVLLSDDQRVGAALDKAGWSVLSMAGVSSLAEAGERLSNFAGSQLRRGR